MAGDKLEKDLQALRAAIDAVDDEILALIHRRAALAADVGAHKHGTGSAPFYVPSREAQIIRRLLAENAKHAVNEHVAMVPDEAVHGIFREIIGACLALEHPLTIAYLGPEGTFSHAAASRQFGSMPRYHPCSSLRMVFDEVESGRAGYGVVPVENAFEGAVTHTLDLFAETDRDVYICAEILLSINEHLFSYAAKLEDIRLVLSHPQPLAQCKQWLETNLPWATTMETSSTVRAAQMIDEARQHPETSGQVDWQHAAAIGPYSIVDHAQLPLFCKDIEDHHGNTTRFYVIGKHDSPSSGEDRTALVMSIRDEPGALHMLIKPLASRGIGLTRIESRPSKRKLWEYVFFIDLIGHRDDPAVAEALDEIQAMPGTWLKVLGSYPVSRKL